MMYPCLLSPNRKKSAIASSDAMIVDVVESPAFA